MKTVIMAVMSLSLLAVIGCFSSPQGGGMRDDEGFKISAPGFDTKLVQGETLSVNIKINRDKYFKRDITLDIRASKGISVTPAEFVVKASAAPEAHLRITAPRDAALGEYQVYVKGTPESGESTATNFTVKVVAP